VSAVVRQEPERAVLFYAADDDAAGGPVAGLIRAAGFDPVRVGTGETGALGLHLLEDRQFAPATQITGIR